MTKLSALTTDTAREIEIPIDPPTTAEQRIQVLEAQREVLELIATGASLKQTLAHLGLVVERLTQASRCSLLFVARGQARLAERTREGLAIMCNDGRLFAESQEVRLPPEGGAWESIPVRNDVGKDLGYVVLDYYGSDAPHPDDRAVVVAIASLLQIAIENEERKRAFSAANERLESLASTIPGVVYQRRVTPDGDIRYTYISEGARDLFGVSPEEILADPQGLFDCHGPEYRAMFRERLLEASRKLRLWEVEAEIITRDGQRKFTHAIARPQKQDDGSVLWNGVILDATRIKEAEGELRDAKEAAEAADKAKTQFLASMSHELRTPLNAVIGFSEAIIAELFGPLGDERYKEYAKDIRFSGSHLLDLINDILDLSRVSAGEFELRDDMIALHELIAACVRLVRESAAASGIRIVVDTGAMFQVRVDEMKLKQIFLNLISNAIKFTPSGGEIKIVTSQNSKGEVDVAIADNGIGIDADDIPNILQPFKQVANSMSRRHEGAGLGLPLANSLIELHGGKLTLTSVGRVGTTALVSIPAERVLDVQSTVQYVECKKSA